MRKHVFKLWVLGIFGALVAGCATQPVRQMSTTFKPVVIDTDQYVQKTNTFLVILDASQSMADTYKGKPKLCLAKQTVCRMNRTIPDLKLTGGLRTFGSGTWSFTNRTDLIYGLTAYSRSGLEAALQKVDKARALSPLNLAIDAAAGDLKSAPGKIAVIVVTDGTEHEMNYGAVLSAAKNLKHAYGDRLCIYPVLVGNDPRGKALLQKVADAGGCGFMTTADAIASPADMADFVRKVFLSGLRDSDGDGVYDKFDQCPGTPKGVKVDAKGCPLDTDGDGVYDIRDKCPRTPKGVKVDADGCPLDTDGDGIFDYLDRCPGTPRSAMVDQFGCWNLDPIHFETDKSEITRQYVHVVNEAASVMRQNPSLKMVIQGHTDSRGTPGHNAGLSKRRALAVMNALVKKGIERSRLSTEAYGATRPIASNLTPEGMAQNRRVELVPQR